MAASRVRRANKRDLGRLVELRSELYVADNWYGDVNTDWPRTDDGKEDLRSYFRRDHLCLVFDERSVVTGFLLGRVMGRSAAMRGRRAELDEIYVAEEGRRHGHGSALLAELTDWWQAAGADRALVSIFEPNTVSQAFFMRNGYEPYLIRLQQRLEQNV